MRTGPRIGALVISPKTKKSVTNFIKNRSDKQEKKSATFIHNGDDVFSKVPQACMADLFEETTIMFCS
jgi:hypothetical protein